MGMNALETRIASVLTAFSKAGKPSTIAHVQDDLGWRFQPVWEVEQLVARGQLRRVANVPGVHCVDGRYEVARGR